MRRGPAGVVSTVLALAIAWAGQALPAGATFPGIAGEIAYGTIDGRIVAVDPETGSTRFLTSGHEDWAPAWSPDGSWLAFARAAGFSYDIYVMRADGTGLRRVVTDGVKPDWSPDGRRIAFATPGSSGIEVVDLDGTDRMRLTGGNDDDPAWSPDGTRIAFWASRHVGPDLRSDIDIYTIEPDGTNETRLTFARGYDFSPDWSPDGSEIVFSSWRASELGDVYVMNADGSGTVRLTDDPDYDVNPVWSPDGDRIAWEVCGVDPEDQGIAVMDADGSDPHLVTRLLYGCTGGYPSWRSLPSQVRVPIDVRPGSSVNAINVASGGVIGVAIVSTTAVDAADVEASTVCFGDAGAPSQRDCTPDRTSLRDVTGDRRPDLVLWFEVRKTGIDPLDRRACLSGSTTSDVALTGCDRIHVVPG